jgi:hypothetical protein
MNVKELWLATDTEYSNPPSLEWAEKFAALVADAERERCVRVVETYRVPVGNSAAGEMAAEWTMDALREIRDAIRGA